MSEKTPEIGKTVLGDQELLEKAMNADNGRKFRLLYEEGWESKVVKRAYDKPRYARLALVNHLIWWARHDIEQVWRLFKRSALFTVKIEQYREYFLELVRSAVSLIGSDCYDPHYRGE